MSTEENEIQILIQYHGMDDTGHNVALEMTTDDLRALARYLSTIRIADISLDAIVRMKDLYDKIVELDKKIKTR